MAASGRIPPPLVDSPKCPRCSLVGICLPDETRALLSALAARRRRCRAVVAVRPERGGRGHPAMPTTKCGGWCRRATICGRCTYRLRLRLGKSGDVLQVHEKDEVVQEVRLTTSRSSTCSATYRSRQAPSRPCAEPRSHRAISRWAAGSTA